MQPRRLANRTRCHSPCHAHYLNPLDPEKNPVKYSVFEDSTPGENTEYVLWTAVKSDEWFKLPWGNNKNKEKDEHKIKKTWPVPISHKPPILCPQLAISQFHQKNWAGFFSHHSVLTDRSSKACLSVRFKSVTTTRWLQKQSDLIQGKVTYFFCSLLVWERKNSQYFLTYFITVIALDLEISLGPQLNSCPWMAVMCGEVWGWLLSPTADMS